MDLEALEAAARDALPIGVYDYFAGGAEDEVTLRDNVEAWARVRLWPRVLRDVTTVDTSTTILGDLFRSPIGLAPTAFQRMAHDEGECATASAAAGAGALHVLSTRATATAAECAAAAPDVPRWYQVYLLQDEKRSERLVLDAREAGVHALVLTVDTPVLGRRLRDVRNRFDIPNDIGAASIHLEPGEATNLVEQRASLTFEDIGKLRELAGLPVVVKGVLRADDARRCLDAGAAAIWVSNHGGRQLDGAVATADALPEVLDAVRGDAEVYVDGGIRRGTDALKALAMGARAVFVGRPALWGLTVGGAAGVRKVLDGLQAELVRAMALAGVPSLADLTPDLVAAARPR